MSVEVVGVLVILIGLAGFLAWTGETPIQRGILGKRLAIVDLRSLQLTRKVDIHCFPVGEDI